VNIFKHFLKLSVGHFNTQTLSISFLPRCIECRRGLAMRILSVRLSVCPSVCPSVRLSVCLSVHHTSELSQNGRKVCPDLYTIIEIRSVERGICPIATSTINERTVPIIMAGCMAHAREGYISTYGLTSDVTLVLLDPDFLKDARISAIRP